MPQRPRKPKAMVAIEQADVIVGAGAAQGRSQEEGRQE